MKNIRLFFTVVWTVLALPVWCQNLPLYDQQSTNLIEGWATLNAEFQPVGQSFQPSFSSIAFVELNLYDSDVFSFSGAFVSVNLRSNSLTGPVLGSTASVFLTNEFYGITNFVFTAPVSVTPGMTYYLQPVIQSGDGVSSYLTDGTYAGGTVFSQGVAFPNYDLWFREGVIVPEPSAVALAVVGVALFGVARWRRWCRGSAR